MNLEDRIARRWQQEDRPRPVVDYGALSPTNHSEEPQGRGPTLEQLLDYLDAIFDGRLPANTYVHGPRGAGKTAAVVALFEHLARAVSASRDAIVTTTRGGSSGGPRFVYVDARRATSVFRLYRAVLRSLLDDEVPGGGVGTDELLTRLEDAVAPPTKSTVVAVDHLGEPRTMGLGDLRAAFAPVVDDVSWLGVGTVPPGDLTATPPEQTLSVPSYEQHALEEVLSDRASKGLAGAVIAHDQLRRIASWAEGDAHDGLAALFGAAALTAEAGASAVREADVDVATTAVPRDGVPMGLILALPKNRRRVLRALVDVEERATVGSTAAAIADRTGVDLSPSTVERILYELADGGVLERVPAEEAESEQGRPPSRIEPRFPTLAFRRLYDWSDGSETG